MIESPALATRLAKAFDDFIPRNSYEVRLAAGGNSVEWVERTDAGETVYTSTPDVGKLRVLWINFLSLLPIEWLL